VATLVGIRSALARRRQLLLDSVGVGASTGGFGLVVGLTAHNAGYSLLDSQAMSVFAFAGAAQFAAIGYVHAHMAWVTIVLLTALVNSRHLLYSASLAPALATVPKVRRGVMAHLLTDETYALSWTHFHREANTDVPGYFIAALVGTFIPFNLGTLIGGLVGGAITNPNRFGLGVVFPAAMAALAVGIMTSRREVVAGASGIAFAVVFSLLFSTSLGFVAGGLLGPLVALCVRPGGPGHEATPLALRVAGDLDADERAGSVAATTKEKR